MPSTSVTTGNPGEFQSEEVKGREQGTHFSPPLVKLTETRGAADKIPTPPDKIGPTNGSNSAD
jgi:hypothetical protein